LRSANMPTPFRIHRNADPSHPSPSPMAQSPQNGLLARVVRHFGHRPAAQPASTVTERNPTPEESSGARVSAERSQRALEEDIPPAPEKRADEANDEQMDERLRELADMEQAQERLAAPAAAQAQDQRDIDQLLSGVLHGNAYTVSNVLKRAPHVINSRLPNGEVALITAIACGHSAMVRQLLASPGVNLAASRASDKATVLHIAAEFGYIDVVNAILARPDAAELALRPDRWGAAAVSLAAGKGHHDVVEALRPFTPPAQAAVKLQGAGRSACRIFHGPRIS